MELDHLFVLLRPDAPDDPLAERLERASAGLREAGLDEGSPNVHPGQGTACRRFFFDNAMFELLWLTDAEAAARSPAERLALSVRASDPAACPFGVAFRPSLVPNEPAGFPHAPYRPAYLPEPLEIQVARDGSPREPLWFHLPFVPPGKRRQDPSRSAPEPREHPAGIERLTAVEITLPDAPGPLARSISASQPIRWLRGKHFRLALIFDHGRHPRVVDPVDGLPLSLRF